MVLYYIIFHMGIKAVVFDMDGLMFDTERVAAEGMLEALRAQGFEADERLLEKLLGVNTGDTLRILGAHYGGRLDPERALFDMDAYLETYTTARGTPVKPGLIALLDALDARRLPRAIASSSPMRRILRNIASADLAGRFDAVVSGDDVSRGKPEPDIFLAAARALGVAPEYCMALEDSPSGVEAAKRAGMKTVMVPDLRAPDARDRAGLFALVPSLFEAIPLLDGEG
jgi:HAD superfamily hydrolase (TIGR01509 family)